MKYKTFQQIRNALIMLIIICNIEQKYLLFFDNYIIFDAKGVANYCCHTKRGKIRQNLTNITTLRNL